MSEKVRPNHNSIFGSIFRRYSIRHYERFNGLYEWSIVNSEIKSNIYNSKIAVDLSDHSFFHFGDILFFIPLILVLSKHANVDVLIDEGRLDFLSALLNGIDPINILVNKKNKKLNYDLLVTSSYKLLDFKNHNVGRVIGLGNLRKPTSLKYPLYFAKVCLRDYLGLSIMNEEIEAEILAWRVKLKSYFVKKSLDDCYNVSESVILFAPFVASGKFRDFLGFKLRSLVSFAIDLSSKHRAVLFLVGGRADKSVAINVDGAVDKRGESLIALMTFAASDKVICGIGFDNFWMHYFDILGKDYYVMFRGRYSKKGNLLHFKSVNLSFKYDGERQYI